MRRQLVAIVTATLLLLSCFAYDGAAASIADSLLNPLRDYLVRAAARYLSRAINGTIEVGALRGSLFSAPVLQQVVVRDAGGAVVARIEEVRVSYELTSLIRGSLMIDAVEIVRPWMRIVQEPDGTLNISELLSAPQADGGDASDAPDRPQAIPSGGTAATLGLPFALLIERLQVYEGNIELEVPTLPGVRTIEGLEARLSGEADAQGLRAQLRQVTANMTPANLSLEQAQGGFEISAGKARIDGLRFRMGDTLLTAAGVIPWSLQPTSFELHLQPLDVGEIGRLLQNEALHGQVRLAARAAGPPEALTVSADLGTGGGRVELHGEVDRVSTPLRYQATLDVTDLDLSTVIERAMLQSDLNLHARVDGAGVSLMGWHGEAQLHIAPSHLGDIALRPSDIHLVAQQQRFEVRRFDLNTSIARMSAGGALDLAGRSDLQYELTAEIAGLRPLLDVQALAGHLQAQGQASGDWPALAARGTLEARDLRYRDNRLRALRLTYEGAQLGAQPEVRTHLEAHQLQAGTLPVEQVGLNATYRGAAGEVRFAAEVVQSAHAGGEANGLVNLTGQGRQVVIGELVVRLPGRTWHAPRPLRVTHRQQRLAFEQVRLVHGGETVELSGAIEGEQLQDLRLHASQIDLTYLRRLLELPDAVAGRASLEARLEGTFEDPTLHSELRLRDGSPPQLPFEQLQATLAYAQRQLQGSMQVQQMDRQVLSLELRLPVELAFTAQPLPQRLVDAPLALNVEVKQPRLAAFHRWQPALPPLTGTLQGTLGVQGTYAALAVDADVQLQGLGVGDIATQVEAPVRLTAEVVTAESVQALAHALRQGQVAPTLRELVLRVPVLAARLPGQSGTPQPIDVRNLVLRADGHWGPDGLEATLQTLHLQASASGMPPAELSMAAQLTPQRLELTGLRVRFPESEVHGQGQLTLPTRRLRFRFEIPRLELDILPTELPPELPSVVQGVILVGGSIQAPEVEARLRYAGAQILADVATQLQGPLPNYRMTVRVEGFNMATVLPEGRGELNARLRLQGEGFTAEQRHATLDLTVDTSDFTLAPGLTAHLQADLAGDAIRLEHFRLRSAPVDVVASGTLSAARRAALTYTVTLGDLTSLENQLGVEVQASGTLSGTVEGPLDALQTHGRLRITDWRYAALRGQRLQAEFSASQLPSAPQATVEARLVGVQGPSLPPSSLRLEGYYSSPQGTFSVTVTEGPYENTLVAGNVSLDAGQQLTLRRLRLQHGDVVWRNVSPIEVARSPQGGLRMQRLVLQSGTQEISAQGKLAPGGAMQAEVHVRQLQIQPTIQAVAPDSPAPEGRLSLDLTLDGTLDQPRARGNVDVTALAWQGRALGDIHADLALRDQALQTNLRWQVQGQELLQVRGTVGLSGESGLQLQVQAPAVGLDLLESISPAVAASEGTLDLDLRVTGTPQQPRMYGSLRLDDGALQLRPTGERYRDVQVRVRFAGDRVLIERLHVGSRTGPLQLTGYVEHTGLSLRRIDLAIQAEEFTAIHTPAVQTVISADIAVRGSQQEMVATGSVTVPEGRVLLDELPWGGPAEVKPWELTVPGVYGPGPEAVAASDAQAASTALGPGFSLPFLRVDLAIEVPRNFWVQAPRTAVELSGELRVTKELDESIALSGTIDTVRGYASYYGKKFEIEEGHVIFTGSEDINPHLDITVTHTVADYVISIHIEGTIEAPEISFSSTPELPQTDIISLLVIGKTTDRLTSSERGALANQLQQIAGGVIAARLEQAIGERLGVDIIEITPGETLGSGAISAGRYLTQKLFVSIGQQFGEEAGFKITLQYSITPHLKLEVSSNQGGGSAVEFLWRRDY